MGMHFNPRDAIWLNAEVPGYPSLLGLNVVIGAKYDASCILYNVSSVVEATERTPRFWVLTPLRKGSRSKSEFKTDAELQALEGAGKFRLANIDPVYGKMRGRAPSIVLVTRDDADRISPKLFWTRLFMASSGFAMSKLRFETFIEEEIGKPDSPPPISFATFYRFYRENEETLWTDPEALTLPQTMLGGRPRDPWGRDVADLIEKVIEGELMKPAPKAENVINELISRSVDADRLPSLRTVQYRISDVPAVTKTILGKGYDRAVALHGHTEVRARPDRPLEVVEGDEVTLDVEVLDDATMINVGRPVLFMLVDRTTNVVLTGVLGLSASFDLLARGIRKSIYPTESPFEGVNHRWYGKGESYALDAAKWNRGQSLNRLKLAVGFDVAELRKKDPQAKGAVEECNRHINHTLSHNLPGAVQGNVEDRAEFEATRIAPMVTLGEMQGLVDDWICNYRNVKLVDHLGAFRKMKAVPDQVWRRNIGKAKTRDPIEPEIFDRVTGQVVLRTIQKEGVRIDHLTYWSDELHDILNHPDHKPGKGKHGGTRYECVLDVGNSAKMTLIDPYRKRAIVCWVIPILRTYAENLPRAVHLKTVAGENEQIRISAKELLRRKTRAQDVAEIAVADRKRRGLDTYFAKFRIDQRNKRIASEVRVATESPVASSGLLDVRNPDVVPPTENVGRTTLGRVPDQDADPAAKRRYANPRRGGREIDRGKRADQLPILSNLSVNVESDLDDL